MRSPSSAGAEIAGILPYRAPARAGGAALTLPAVLASIQAALESNPASGQLR